MATLPEALNITRWASQSRIPRKRIAAFGLSKIRVSTVGEHRHLLPSEHVESYLAILAVLQLNLPVSYRRT